MASSPFVHLHCHTQYSLLDGAIRLDDLMERAKSFGMNAVSITDHGNLFGAMDFYIKAKKAGLKPIIGCEVYVTSGSRFDKTSRKSGESFLNHLVLLVQDRTGYENLLKIVSCAYLESFYYKPRVDKELLNKYNKGIIALSACLKGEIPHLLLNDRRDEAIKQASLYSDIYDNGRFFLELQDNGIKEQVIVNERLIKLSKHTGIPLVATNDCHYLEQGDAVAHDILLCIQTGKIVTDKIRMRFSTDQLYYKSPQEMIRAFSDCPDAIKNTILIAERCNLELETDKLSFPSFTIEKGETLEGRLEKDARTGFEIFMKRRGEDYFKKSKKSLEKYYERLEEELAIINKMGFAGYFLIVADFINWSKSNDIPVGPGRGSAAGSLVAFALGITNIDPLLYDLLFERFLNPERVSMPDIDVDFCVKGRNRVINYVSEKYGKENVAQITTFGALKARAVVRDVARAMDIPYAHADRLAKLIPEKIGSLDEAVKINPDLKKAIDSDQGFQELFKNALRLEGLCRHASTHAAGVVIGDKKLVEYLPLYRGKEGELVTQFNMKVVEKSGLIKFDFLGLRNLTIIDNTLKLIKKSRDIEIDINNLPLDDEPTYELLSQGNTTGVFQLESSGMKDLLIKMQPQNFEDIIALVALYRPGPLGSGMVDDFIDRKHGKKQIIYPHPLLEDILKPTYGVILYQEQVMQIAQVLAGYSLGEADLLRRAMGKKLTEAMAEQKVPFIERAGESGVDEKKAGEIFDLMAKFGEYGFNKSHSAAYALIAFQTAYLKANYPVAFMASILTSDMNNTDRVVFFISECKAMSINVLPPDINTSEKDFTVIDDVIRFGLAAVKNVGSGAIDSIIDAREKTGMFENIYNFCEHIDLRKVNRRVIESLIKCGAFDFSGHKRSGMVSVLDAAIDRAQSIQKDEADGQLSIFSIINDKQGDSAMSSPVPSMSDIDEYPEKEMLAFEKEILGFFISGHPMDEYESECRKCLCTQMSMLSEAQDKSNVHVAGLVGGIKEITTKKGDRMGFLTMEDVSGSIEVVVFSDLYHKLLSFNPYEKPILVTGRLEHGEKSSKIIGSDIFLLEDASHKLAKNICLKIDIKSQDFAKLLSLKDVLASYPGECNPLLTMEFAGEYSVILSLGKAFYLDPCQQLISDVEDILGKGNISYVLNGKGQYCAA